MWRKYIKKRFPVSISRRTLIKYEDASELVNFTNLLTNYQSSNIRKTWQIGLCNENKSTNICGGCRKYVCGKSNLKKSLFAENA